MGAEQRSDVALIGELGELLRVLDKTEMPLHLYQCVSDATARLVNQAKEIARLRAELEEGERAHLQTIDERDRFEDRVTEIARAFGITEEWSSQTDLGQLAVESAGSLRAELEDFKSEASRARADLDDARAELRKWIDAHSDCGRLRAELEEALETIDAVRDEVLSCDLGQPSDSPLWRIVSALRAYEDARAGEGG